MSGLWTLGLVIMLGIGIVVGYEINELWSSEQITKLQTQIKDRDHLISELQNQTAALEAQIDALKGQLKEKSNEVAQLQLEITRLQSEIEKLKSLVSPLRLGEWNLIAKFNGTSSLTTDYFYVAGADLRINWTYTTLEPEYAFFSFTLTEEGETVAEYASGAISIPSGTTYIHNLDEANYFLTINAINMKEWTITVEVWIPE